MILIDFNLQSEKGAQISGGITLPGWRFIGHLKQNRLRSLADRSHVKVLTTQTHAASV
jgi:hypothetical protein